MLPSSSLRTICSSSSRACSKRGLARRHRRVSSTRATSRPRARRTPTRSSTETAPRLANDGAGLVLHDRVAALERRRRAEQRAAGRGRRRPGPTRARAGGPAAAASRSPLAVQRRPADVDPAACGRAKAGRATSSSSVRRAWVAPPSSARAPRVRSASSDAGAAAWSGTISFALPGWACRRGRRPRGRRAACPARGRWRRRPASGTRRPPGRRLVGEREQILGAAAAAGEHDHVDLGVGVERPQRRCDRRPRPGALHRRLDDPKPHRRVAAARPSRPRRAWPPRRFRTRARRPAGRNGSGRLRSAAKSPSAASRSRTSSIRRRSWPRPNCSIAYARNRNSPRSLPQLAAAEHVRRGRPTAGGGWMPVEPVASASSPAGAIVPLVLEAEEDEPPAVACA